MDKRLWREMFILLHASDNNNRSKFPYWKYPRVVRWLGMFVKILVVYYIFLDLPYTIKILNRHVVLRCFFSWVMYNPFFYIWYKYECATEIYLPSSFAEYLKIRQRSWIMQFHHQNWWKWNSEWKNLKRWMKTQQKACWYNIENWLFVFV